MIVAAAATSSIAYLVKPVLDQIFVEKDREMLMILPFLVILAYAGKSIGTYIQTYYISYIGKDIVRRIRDRFLEHMLLLDMAFFGKYHGGDLTSRVVNDTNRIQAAVSNHVAVFIREMITAIGLIGIVIYQSPTLAFYSLVVMPLAFYPLSVLAQRMKKISHKSQEKNADILSSLSEIFNNIEIIKAHTSEKHEQERFAVHNLGFFKIEMKGVKTSEAVNPLMELMGAFAAALVIGIGGSEVIEGSLSIGAFFSFMTALFMLYTPIRQMSAIYNKLQDALAANERINHLMDLKPEIRSGPEILDTHIDRIEYKDVVLEYGEKRALNGIDVRIGQGDCVALVGASGGGKSSFVNLLLRFFDTTSGGIEINGRSIRDYSFESLRKQISIVTQRVYIFNDTVAQNVAYGQIMDEERIIESLKQAHAWEFVEQLEHGIHTTLDEFGANLSGGQRQRIAIARALYKKPQVLVFDEATSALDNESEREISRALEEIKRDKIVIIIAHRLSTIKMADTIHVFVGGKIVCSGPEPELLETCGHYKKLYQSSEIL